VNRHSKHSFGHALYCFGFVFTVTISILVIFFSRLPRSLHDPSRLEFALQSRVSIDIRSSLLPFSYSNSLAIAQRATNQPTLRSLQWRAGQRLRWLRPSLLHHLPRSAAANTKIFWPNSGLSDQRSRRPREGAYLHSKTQTRPKQLLPRTPKANVACVGNQHQTTSYPIYPQTKTLPTASRRPSPTSALVHRQDEESKNRLAAKTNLRRQPAPIARRVPGYQPTLTN